MKLISKIKSSTRIPCILRWLIVFFSFAYAFAIPSFGYRKNLIFIIYGILAVLFILLVMNFIFYNKIFFKPYLVCIPLFAIYAFIGTAIYSKQFRGWFTLILLVVSFFVLFYSFSIINKKELCLDILLGGIFAFCLYYIFHYRREIISFSSYGNESFRLGVYFGNQNDIASYCIIGVVLSTYLFLFRKGSWKFIYIIPLISIFIVGFTTGSRSFVLSSLFAIILILFFRMYHHKLLFLITMSVLIFSFFIFLNIPFMGTIKERLTRMISTFFSDTTQVDTSTLSRSIWLDYAFALGSKNVITGYGYGGFSVFSGVGTYAHSNVAELFADFGLIGSLTFYSPYFISCYLMIKNKNAYIKLLLPSFLLFILISFSMVFFYNKLYYVFLALLLFLTAEPKYQYCKHKYFSSRKNIKNILVVTDKYHYEQKEFFIFLSLLKKYLTDATYHILVFGLDEDLLNVSSCLNKHTLIKLFVINKTIKKQKAGTVIAYGQNNVLLVERVSFLRNFVKIFVLTETPKFSYLYSRCYDNRKFLTIVPSGHKNAIYSKLNDSIFDKIDILFESFATYENTFNWK